MASAIEARGRGAGLDERLEVVELGRRRVARRAHEVDDVGRHALVDVDLVEQPDRALELRGRGHLPHGRGRRGARALLDDAPLVVAAG
jgi:hypothetical protein